jgi:hypothetical protein
LAGAISVFLKLRGQIREEKYGEFKCLEGKVGGPEKE